MYTGFDDSGRASSPPPAFSRKHTNPPPCLPHYCAVQTSPSVGSFGIGASVVRYQTFSLLHLHVLLSRRGHSKAPANFEAIDLLYFPQTKNERVLKKLLRKPGTCRSPPATMVCHPRTGTIHMEAPVHARAIITSARFLVRRRRYLRRKKQRMVTSEVKHFHEEDMMESFDQDSACEDQRRFSPPRAHTTSEKCTRRICTFRRLLYHDS